MTLCNGRPGGGREMFIPHTAPGFSGAKSILYLKYNGDVKLHKGFTFAAWHRVRGRYFESREAGALSFKNKSEQVLRET